MQWNGQSTQKAPGLVIVVCTMPTTSLKQNNKKSTHLAVYRIPQVWVLMIPQWIFIMGSSLLSYGKQCANAAMIEQQMLVVAYSAAKDAIPRKILVQK